jgi:hypothetical protein
MSAHATGAARLLRVARRRLLPHTGDRTPPTGATGLVARSLRVLTFELLIVSALLASRG